ncbi:TolC family protein [Gelidibacter salicanalis]|uniref:TolC family protein n=1 Tax=Gelidibacter salicanalis TaxID=291193 RepID=A0A934KS09_9FLAO|nr:TolC family protein [Gelidibacter salicanalis]MBJ7879618.1 TolC family protein [Gelidibacter salicanalis]
MHQKIIWILVLGTLLQPNQLFSQNVWTLDACIAYALEHSLSQTSQKHREAISEERWKQSKRDMLPTIGVSYPSYNVSFGRTLDPVTNSFVESRFVSGLSGGLSSSVMLFEAFRKWHALAYQKLVYQSSKFDAQQSQYDLAFKIMDLFNNVLFQEGALDILKEQQAVNLLYEKEIIKKVVLELNAKADLYDIEATTSGDALEVLKAENALKAAKLALLQEMNLEADHITIIQDKAVEFTPKSATEMNLNEVFNTALEVLPSLQISKFNVAASEKELAITKTELYPSIRLGGGISTSYSDNFRDFSGSTIPFDEQVKNNQSKYIGLSLNFPIFNNGRTRSSIKIAGIELENSKTQLKIEKQRTYKIIQELLQKNEALIAEEALNLKKLKAKEKAYDIAQKKFDKKIINLYDLQIASNAYSHTKIEQVRLIAQMAIQKRTLDFYKGKFILPTLAASN